MHTLSILLYCAAFSSVLGAQAPYGVIRGSPSSVDNLSALGSNGALSPGSPYNVTSMHLSQIKSKDVFTTLMHPKFPGHQVRVKKSQFCDPTVNVYTGFLDVDQGAKHLFFYFFESRRDPDKDDVMMWINGGPGGSSTIGLLMELGPCNIDTSNNSSNGTLWNPYAWNNEANLFFLDQPVGVGFSYADFGETVETTEDAAKNVQAFITIFFETFSQFKGRAFHIAGESYGGRYVPVFASEIYDQNTVAKAEGRPTINLQSILIGNGRTDPLTDYPGKFEVECGKASLDTPIQPISACVRMKQALPKCQKLLKRHCIDTKDAINCQGAVLFCENELESPYKLTGLNYYDVTKPCGENSLCYDEIDYITSYFNNNTIRDLLGVSHDIPFSVANRTVGNAFIAHLDIPSPAQFYVAGLLERGVRVLIYAGTYDWICNWVSNLLWLEFMEWSGQREYVRGKWRVWGIDDSSIHPHAHQWINADWTMEKEKRKMSKGVGITKSAGPLTYASIWEAGHMISISTLLALTH